MNPLTDPAPSLHCHVTRNPCGTDTWTIGYPCRCASCTEYMRSVPVIRSTPTTDRESLSYQFADQINALFERDRRGR